MILQSHDRWETPIKLKLKVSGGRRWSTYETTRAENRLDIHGESIANKQCGGHKHRVYSALTGKLQASENGVRVVETVTHRGESWAMERATQCEVVSSQRGAREE